MKSGRPSVVSPLPFHLQSLPLALSILGAVPAWAEPDLVLDPVVVTASRTAESASESLASVTVIERHEIERSSARNLPELLLGQPGVNVTNAGGFGKKSSFFLRGTESDHFLLLVDGVRLASATDGAAALQLIPLSQIERIEIVRGPRSSLYGAEAIGGVIQIFTRQERSSLSTELQLGSHESMQLTQSFATSTERTRASLTASFFDTLGINAQKGAQSDNDGYNTKSVAASVDHQWNEQWQGGASLLRVQGRNEYDNSFDGPETALMDEVVQQVTQAYLDYAATADVGLQLRVGHSRDESENFRNSVANGEFTTDRYLATLQGDWQVAPDHLFTGGVDYYEDRVEASTDYSEDRRENLAQFIQWQGAFERFDWQASARHDDNDAVGSQQTWNGALGYNFGPWLRAFTAYGTAFKAPSFNDLFWPFDGFYRGNPDLRVEESRSWEIGLQGEVAGSQWALAYFETEVDDLITFDLTLGTSVNLAEAEMSGAELSWTGAWEQWQAQVSATYLEAEDRRTGRELPLRPTWSGRVRVGYGWADYVASLTLRAQDETYNDAANTQDVPGFGVLDVGLTWLPSEHWTVKLEALNALDQDYELIRGYNTEGRTYWLTFAYRQ